MIFRLICREIRELAEVRKDPQGAYDSVLFRLALLLLCEMSVL